MAKRGRKPGFKFAATLSKEEAREALRTIVMREMEAMTAAQIAHAKGIKFLVARQKAGGKFTRVTEAELDRILAGQDDETTILEVWDKDPNVQAYTDLMNRALDKAKEQEQEIKVSGSLDVVARLQAARNRLAGRK